MFITLLVVDLAVSLMVCLATAVMFYVPLVRVLRARLSTDAASMWAKLLVFILFVPGVSVGTRVWDVGRYVEPDAARTVTRDLLALEAFRTGIATLEVNAVALVIVLAAVALIHVSRKAS